MENAWAPCIEEKMVDGKYKYFFYFSGNPVAGGKQIGVAVADSPIGPFKDLGHPIITESARATDSRLMWMCLLIRFRENPLLYWGNGYMAAPN